MKIDDLAQKSPLQRSAHCYGSEKCFTLSRLIIVINFSSSFSSSTILTSRLLLPISSSAATVWWCAPLCSNFWCGSCDTEKDLLVLECFGGEGLLIDFQLLFFRVRVVATKTLCKYIGGLANDGFFRCDDATIIIIFSPHERQTQITIRTHISYVETSLSWHCWMNNKPRWL